MTVPGQDPFWLFHCSSFSFLVYNHRFYKAKSEITNITTAYFRQIPCPQDPNPDLDRLFASRIFKSVWHWQFPACNCITHCGIFGFRYQGTDPLKLQIILLICECSNGNSTLCHSIDLYAQNTILCCNLWKCLQDKWFKDIGNKHI